MFVFSAPRPRRGFVFYPLYIQTLTRASLSVGLPVHLCVCLFRSVCFFVSLFLCFLHYSDRDSGSSFIYYSLQEQIRFSVEWSPWRAWRPTTPRQSSRTAPSLPAGTRSRFNSQEQAARLPVSLQQGRIRSVSRQDPATIIYSGQHRHRDA